MSKLRDDLALTAYALMLGFEVKGHSDVALSFTHFNDDGIPSDGLQFAIGDMHVWDTARGWRVGRLWGGLFEKSTDSSFYTKLKAALDEAARNWRDR